MMGKLRHPRQGAEIAVFEDCSDSRLRGWCAHCGKLPDGEKFTKDHVPSKSLLVNRNSKQLPVVDVCPDCNNQFAKDEEYLAVLLASVISGSTDVDPGRFPSASRAIARSPRLRKRIEQSRREHSPDSENPGIIWVPELNRVERVLTKNARGHVLFETGQAVTDPPLHVGIAPIGNLSEELRFNFEGPQNMAQWPEVGSRSMQRVAVDLSSTLGGGESNPGRWVVVEEEVYRYSVDDELTVRMVLCEYLAAEVAWDR